MSKVQKFLSTSSPLVDGIIEPIGRDLVGHLRALKQNLFRLRQGNVLPLGDDVGNGNLQASNFLSLDYINIT